MSLRELLMFQSIYSCKNQYDIEKLIEVQPEPKSFYKSFLEIDKQNLISVLSFDNKSIKRLLEDKFEPILNNCGNSSANENRLMYPLFYKTRMIKNESNDNGEVEYHY